MLFRIVLPLPTLYRLMQPSADPELLYEPRPRASVRFEGLLLRIPPTDVQLDRNGLRINGEQQPSATEPTTSSARPAILLVGDSFAFGQGVANSETLSAELQRGADAQRCPVRVDNGAVSGYNGQQVAAWTRRLLENTDVRYDTVIYWAVRNDLLPAQDHLRPFPIGNSALRYSALVRAAVLTATFVRMMWNGRRYYTPQEGQRLGDAIRRLSEVVSEVGAKLFVLEVPWIPELAFSEDERTAARRALPPEVQWIVIPPPSAERLAPRALSIPRDGHLTPKALALLAEELRTGPRRIPSLHQSRCLSQRLEEGGRGAAGFP
jgi:hypothetical protein